MDLTSTALHDSTGPSYRRPKQARSHQDSSAGGGGPIPRFSGGIDVQLQCLLDAAPRLQRPSLQGGVVVYLYYSYPTLYFSLILV